MHSDAENVTDPQSLSRLQVRRLYRAALLAVLAIAIIAASLGVALEVSARWVQHTREVLQTVADLQQSLLTTEAEALRSFSAVGPADAASDNAAASVRLQGLEDTSPLLARLIMLTQDNLEQQQRAQRLTETVGVWNEELQGIVAGRDGAAFNLANAQLRTALEAFHDAESSLYAERVTRQQRWRAALIAAILASLALVAFALHRVMRGSLVESRRRVASEAERDRARRMLEFALDSSPLAISVVGPNGAMILQNDTWRQLAEQAETSLLEQLQPQIDAVRDTRLPQVSELSVHVRTDGEVADPDLATPGKSVRTLAVSAYAVGQSPSGPTPSGPTPSGKTLSAQPSPVQVGLVLFDLTDQRWLETQLRHAQRMESLGRLAGGVAHDINNVLTAIIGFTEMAQHGAAHLPQADGNVQHLMHDLQQVRRAADRAAMMARQLLTFSRQNVLRVRALDPGEVASDLEPMLRRILGSHVQFRVRTEPGVWSVMADPSQVEQVVLNLAINARDAMDGGGELTVRISNLPASDVRTLGVWPPWPAEREPVDCVRIAVTDTGGGIPDSVRSRIFEPFFTTKAAGKGTGLGLATVRQIVGDLSGHIAFETAAGVGTTFSVLLPRVAAAPEPMRVVPPTASVSARRGHVLVAEDDRDVRFLTEYVLGEAGFTVHTVRNGRDAVNAIENAEPPFDVLLTDLVMPDLGGVALGEHPVVRSRGIVVLYMSGYPADTYGQQTTVPEASQFLAKPFSPAALLEAVAGAVASAVSQREEARA